MCEARSQQFDGWVGPGLAVRGPAVSPACDKWTWWIIYQKRWANKAYHLLVPLFSSFTASVVCHKLLLFGKLPLGIISFDFLYDCFTRPLPLLSFPVMSAFTLIPSTIRHLWNQLCCVHRCPAQYVNVVLKLFCSFIKRDGSAHIHTHIYIYIYIHTYIYIYIHTYASSESDCGHQD